MAGVYDRTLEVSLAPLGQPDGIVTIRNPMWLKQRDLLRLQSATTDPGVLADWLSGLIEGWTLADYDGTPIPYRKGADGIEDLPLVIVRYVFEAIAKELNVPLEITTS